MMVGRACQGHGSHSPEQIKELLSEASVLKAWSANQLHWHHLEACLKCKIVGPLQVAEWDQHVSVVLWGPVFPSNLRSPTDSRVGVILIRRDLL